MKKRDIQLLAEIKLFIDARLDQDIPVKELCSKFSINKNKLQKGFKFLYHKTIHAYMLDQKMELAAEKLSMTNHPVKAIALELGYTASNFHSKFKKKFGYTPEWIRKKNNTDKGI
jgi:AraC-like DNA-binding protein